MIIEIVTSVIIISLGISAYKRYKQAKSDRMFLTDKDYFKKYGKLL